MLRFIRHSSGPWINRLSRFSPKPTPKPPKTEPSELAVLSQHVRATDIPPTTKEAMIRDKLAAFVQNTTTIAPHDIKHINQGFNELHRLSGSLERTMDEATRVQLFQKSAQALVANPDTRIPRYMAVLIRDLLRRPTEPSVLAHLVDLGSSMSSFATVIKSLEGRIRRGDLDAIMRYFWERGRLDIERVEILTNSAYSNSASAEFEREKSENTNSEKRFTESKENSEQGKSFFESKDKSFDKTTANPGAGFDKSNSKFGTEFEKSNAKFDAEFAKSNTKSGAGFDKSNSRSDAEFDKSNTKSGAEFDKSNANSAGAEFGEKFEEFVFGDDIIKSFFSSLLEELPPTHDTNLLIFRTQHLLTKLIPLTPPLSLLRLSWDLQVFHNPALSDQIRLSITSATYSTITKHLFANPEDTGLILGLLWRCKHEKRVEVAEFIAADPIRFEGPHAKLYLALEGCVSAENPLVHRLVPELDENAAYSALEPILTYSSDFFTETIEACMNFGISARGYLIETLASDFRAHGVDIPPEAYLHRLDAAIARGKLDQALHIFDDGVESLIQWNEAGVYAQRVLNSLIVLLCKETEDIVAIFPIFTRIKQQMGSVVDVNALNALSERVLQAEYASDMIEMMKRELPQIPADSAFKLPVEPEWASSYRELFWRLHKYVVSYEKDPIYETNWVLYGELHKYFVVPFESYLPTMRFFCQHGRPDWALTVFHQLRRLHDLHGAHSHRPPSREMYLYLLQQFGDKLYENGVVDVHEYLKMDVNLDTTDVELHNAVLDAYSDLQDVPRAHNLFLSMAADSKSFNEETIQIMIKTYTYNDLAYVQTFWNNLSQYGVLPTPRLYRQYLIAHVYHGLVEKALALADGMAEWDLVMDEDTMVALHNYTLDRRGQKRVEEWARERHGELWGRVGDRLIGGTGYEVGGLIEGSNRDNN